MDQAEPSAPQSRPGQNRQQAGPDRPGRPVPQSRPADQLFKLQHPVIAGYDGSCSSRNALAYAAGLATRLDRPLLVLYICSSGVYCEPLTGQVVGVSRDTDAVERWLLAEIDQVTGRLDADVHVRTRRGSPARELASAAAELSADALVIGAPTHFWHRICGSVPSWLSRHAKCPVIVVP